MARFLVLKAADALHLTLHHGYTVEEAYGRVDGVELHCAWRDAAFAWNGYWRGTVETSIPMRPPLDLGLVVISDDPVVTAAGQSSPPPGAFDAHFRVTGEEPARVAALLDATVRAGLEALVQRRLQVTLRDEVLRVVRPIFGPTEVDDVVGDVRAAVAVARALDAARPGVPGGARFAEHVLAARHYAQSKRLAVSATPPMIWGRVEHGNVSTWITRNAPGWSTAQARILFDRSLGIGLQIMPTPNLDAIGRFWSGLTGEDHIVGDPAFDAAFVVKTPHPERLQTVLPERARALLLEENARFGNVHLVDGALELGPLPLAQTSASVLADMVESASALATALTAG